MTILSGALIDIDGTFLFILVIFAVLYFVLRSTLFKPFLALTEAREEAIEGARHEAKQMQKDAKEKSAKFEDEMRRVRLESGSERDRLRQEGQRLERQILERVREETQAALATADEQLRQEAKRVQAQLDTTVAAMGQTVASRLLGRELN